MPTVFDGRCANWRKVKDALRRPDLRLGDGFSTYVQNPPYFEGMDDDAQSPSRTSIEAQYPGPVPRFSITTDHISPAGNIRSRLNSPAGKYLSANGVRFRRPTSTQFGTRRGNHEVMMRGTFANIRIKNQMVKDPNGAVDGGRLHRPLSRPGDRDGDL